jgi:hypothetical protein
MKRMTLLTALALVFSLFTVTAAIAGSGLGTGDSEQSGALDRIQAETQPNEAACQADDCPAGDAARTQTREMVKSGDCQADDCPAGDAARTQTREMVKSGDCQADDCPADEAPITQAQMRERLTNQILEMLGSKSAEVEAQYRHILNFMLQNMLRFRVVLFV